MIHFVKFKSAVGGKTCWNADGIATARVVGDFVVFLPNPNSVKERVVPMSNVAHIDRDVTKKPKRKKQSDKLE